MIKKKKCLNAKLICLKVPRNFLLYILIIFILDLLLSGYNELLKQTWHKCIHTNIVDL